MRTLFATLGLSAALLAGCEPADNPPTDPPKRPPFNTSATPVYDWLGKYARKVATSNQEAQAYFNQGLNYLYAFNHDAAIRAFERAAALDSECAMAHWGVAIANGPHINNTAVPPARAKAAWAALAKAREHAKTGSDVEQALIEALDKRYADPQPDDRKPLDEAYAAAMREVYKRFPKDADVGVLFAESLMDLRPWDLWSADGKPRPETPEVIATLDAVLEQSPNHPLALHLYIHAVEASPNPEKAVAVADRLRALDTGLGHLIHMPAHIDLRLGRWQKSIETNEKAIAADVKYREAEPRQDFYRLYMAHNRHMLAFAAMMQGESKRAMEAVRAMLAEIPETWLAAGSNAAIVDGFHAMPIEVMIRFGRWEEVLKEPEPAERFPIARALRHSARGVAYAAQGKTVKARCEQELFRDAVAATPKGAAMMNNSAADLFAVADGLLEGEILVAEGNREEGLKVLRAAVVKEDALKYDEPPDWVHPVRHALGATLLKAGQPAEAEQVYREDLKRWPTNGWALFGLAASLDAQRKGPEAAEVRERFREAWKYADVKLSSSCFCQPGKP